MIHLVIGRQGSGKSLFLVFKAYECYKKGFTVYSNIHLTYKCNKPLLNITYKKNKSGNIMYDKNGEMVIEKIMDYRLLPKEKFFNKFGYYMLNYQDIIDCNLKNGSVFIDEVHLLLSSRNSTSVQSREICDSFLSMVRRKNLEVYGTTQTSRKVDIRFREERDFFYMCEKHIFINGNWTIALTNYDYPKNVPVMIKLTVLEEFSGNMMTFNFLGNSLFNLYDSTQVIKIEEVKKTKEVKE